jgi:hypothetical protein
VGAPLPSGRASLRPAGPCRAAPLRPNCLITGVAPAPDGGAITVAGNSGRVDQRSKQAERCRRDKGAPEPGARRPPCSQVRAGRATCVPALGISPQEPGTDLITPLASSGAPERPVLHIQDRATRSTGSAPERRECARRHAEYQSRSVMTRGGEGLGAVVPDALSGSAAFITAGTRSVLRPITASRSGRGHPVHWYSVP